MADKGKNQIKGEPRIRPFLYPARCFRKGNCQHAERFSDGKRIGKVIGITQWLRTYGYILGGKEQGAKWHHAFPKDDDGRCQPKDDFILLHFIPIDRYELAASTYFTKLSRIACHPCF